MPQNVWWLITWTTYGTWLPGDPRGFQTWRERTYVPPPKRYAQPGEPTYQPKDYTDLHAQSRQNMEDNSPVWLTPEQQKIVLEATIEDLSKINITPAVLSVGNVHLHLLASVGTTPIRPLVARLKAAATWALKEQGFHPKRLWAKSCHMKSKQPGKEFENALAYIQRHTDEGCLVHCWFNPIAE